MVQTPWNRLQSMLQVASKLTQYKASVPLDLYYNLISLFLGSNSDTCCQDNLHKYVLWSECVPLTRLCETQIRSKGFIALICYARHHVSNPIPSFLYLQAVEFAWPNTVTVIPSCFAGQPNHSFISELSNRP